MPFVLRDGISFVMGPDETMQGSVAEVARRFLELTEDVNPVTGELWGNFPQTYSMVGLIDSATRLSIPWDQAF